MPSSPTFPADRVSLRRALGRWDLTAIGINQVIGGAIFLMPAPVAAQLGDWSVVGFVLAGMASLLVALCFAEVSSRFESTGGPSLYARAAFGRFAGFEVGWMQWFTRASSQASIMAGIAVALGYYWPAVTAGWPRHLLLTAVTTTLAWINVRGIRQSAWVVNALTIGKLVPLALFILIGLAFVEPSRLTSLPLITWRHASTAALMLIFVYGGYDVVPVPAGEAIDPQRHVPFALVTTILSVTAVMTLTQIVAQGVLPDLAAHKTPIADAAAVMIGGGGALLVGVGSVVARFRTPANAVIVTSAVALLLALSGSWEKLAVVSALARLVTYTGACASTLRLRSLSSRGVPEVRPATFIAPLGPGIPIIAIAVSLAVIAGASRQQLLGGGAALAAGAALFGVNLAVRPRRVAA